MMQSPSDAGGSERPIFPASYRVPTTRTIGSRAWGSVQPPIISDLYHCSSSPSQERFKTGNLAEAIEPILRSRIDTAALISRRAIIAADHQRAKLGNFLQALRGGGVWGPGVGWAPFPAPPLGRPGGPRGRDDRQAEYIRRSSVTGVAALA